MMNNSGKLVKASHPPSESVSVVFRRCSPYDNEWEDVEPVTYSYPYFLRMTRTFYQGVSDADLQDIAQEAWVSYSRISEKVEIDKPEAYIAKIIRNKFKDFMRKEKRRCPLLTISLSVLTENSEVELTPLSNHSLINPVNELDDQVDKMEFIHTLAFVLPKVAPRQRRVLICTLLDNVDDPYQLKQALKSNHIDVTEMCWPSTSAEKRLLQASLPAARRSLAYLLNIDLYQFKHRKCGPGRPPSSKIRP